MRKETSGGNDILIYCVNHACASNGGDNFSAIQADATADLQPQVEQLRSALEKCVVALESEPFHSWRVKEAINTAKPLLNKP